MSTFKLIVLRDKLVLTTERILSAQEAHLVREAFAAWTAGQTLVVPDCEVEDARILDVELDLPNVAETRHERLLHGEAIS